MWKVVSANYMDPDCTLLSYLPHVLECGRRQPHNHKPFFSRANLGAMGGERSVLQLDGRAARVAPGHDEMLPVTAVSE